MKTYDHKKIEKKWQKEWEKKKLYVIKDKVKGKKNFYTLFEFPYPSGNLHIGHWYAFAIPDIFARIKRMQGYNVLFPIGFDAFGLPAENAAIQRGLNPKKWTYQNISYMEGQLQSMGASFDWSRKVITSDQDYYKWTQWLFLQFYKKGLAYKKAALVNWCPKDQTVLANEQVVNGKCDRCGTEVVQKDLEQWFFKITDYADRLLKDLDQLDWPESIKESQRNWIGRSEGAEIGFKIEFEGGQQPGLIPAFTTRADTLYGATFFVLAPEHVWVTLALDDNHKGVLKNTDEVRKYVEEAKKKTEIERTDASKEKTGVKLEGVWAVNPATNEKIPIFVADYVIGHYGTGAVMGVPAHDERDFEFAKKYNLPIKHVVIPYRPDDLNPQVPGKEVIFRNAVIVVLKNPKTGKYVGLKWKKQPWTTFIMGGIEEGETPVEAATREIKEESGYQNFKLIRVLGGPTQAEFYAAHKGVNRTTHTWSILFELQDEVQEELAPEEADIHDVIWLTQEEINKGREVITHSEIDVILRRMNKGETAYEEEGVLMDSGEFNGMMSMEAREKIAEKFGKMVVKYKLRDWLLSRQRYWGCPIPVVYDPEGKPHPVPEKHLPWKLPEDKIDLTPKGKSPLASSKELEKRTEKIFGLGWRSEYDTMDTFVDSSWYFLRYTDPKNKKKFADKMKLKNWMPVGKYSGGAEHTTMHLLYSRFFHKALFDMELVNESEPYINRMNRGLILGPDGQKMSKSKGNVIDPDEQVKMVGADSVRMYLAFIGPYNEVGQYPWDIGGIVGVRRFLERVWKLQFRLVDKNNNPKITTALHKTIKKVTTGSLEYKFNTAIAAMMILLNEIEKEEISRQDYEIFIKLLSPFAPHMTEEIWGELGHKKSIHLEAWPKFDPDKIVEEEKIIGVQINGKVRATLSVGNDEKEEGIKVRALDLEEVKRWTAGKEIKRVIYVVGRVINIVVA